ncbi:hypothetical protein HQN60_12600 [Deefgea piscis]|uniref:Uncharacterized protein n=1 Tax=Deefgea piscis TaxID=2739061 RepID=A0A6M8T0E0_9NEIS|nr:hypothetical protein [Deefgea piscis]QKJ67477.1 hypothetical protein HQN60_12600 [Deefgea piscis]
MADPIPSVDLVFARDALAAARAAYLSYQQGGNAVVQEYRIGGGGGADRSMKYRDGADFLKQITHWQKEVRTLEAAEGFKPRTAQIKVRF